jgi:hypothetical protein
MLRHLFSALHFPRPFFAYYHVLAAFIALGLCIIAPQHATANSLKAKIYTLDRLYPDTELISQTIGTVHTVQLQRAEPPSLWLQLSQGKLRALPVELNLPIESRPPRMIRNGFTNTGSDPFIEAWLTTPSNRYPHGALGGIAEPTQIWYRLTDRKIHAFKVGNDYVIEDSQVRIADLDRDGDSEMFIVRSHVDKGSSLAVIEYSPYGPFVAAETQPLGQYRWLNPIGADDLNNDGHKDIAIVTTPHSTGTLEIYRYNGADTLSKWASFSGVSNHVFGSPDTRLSALADISGSGIPEIIIPNTNRTALLVLSAKSGRIEQVMRIDDPNGHINAPLLIADLNDDDRPDVIYKTDDGHVRAIVFYRD